MRGLLFILTTFITGLQIEAVFADFATFLKMRKKPTQPVKTFTGKLPTATEFVEQPIHIEDYATVMLRYSSGARGILLLGMSLANSAHPRPGRCELGAIHQRVVRCGVCEKNPIVDL